MAIIGHLLSLNSIFQPIIVYFSRLFLLHKLCSQNRPEVTPCRWPDVKIQWPTNRSEHWYTWRLLILPSSLLVLQLPFYIFPVTTSLSHVPCYNFSIFPVTTPLLQLPCYIFRVTSSLSQLIRYIFPVATSPLHLPCYNIYRSLSHHHHFSRFHLVWLWRPCWISLRASYFITDSAMT